MPYHFRQAARNVSRPRLSPSSPSGSPGMHPFLGADGGPPLLVTCSGDAVSWSHPFAPCLSSSPPFFAIRCIRLRLFFVVSYLRWALSMLRLFPVLCLLALFCFLSLQSSPFLCCSASCVLRFPLGGVRLFAGLSFGVTCESVFKC